MANQAGIDDHNGMENAEKLAAGYKSIDRTALHNKLFAYLDDAHAHKQELHILDIGCGSGDDAYLMAQRGHHVVGIEPSDLRTLAERDHAHDNIQYRDGRLPALSTVRADEQFDLVMMSAVWQYIDPAERVDSLVKIGEHLKPGGSLYLSYASPPSRKYQFEVPPDQLDKDIAAANARLSKGKKLNVVGEPDIIPDPRGRKDLKGERDLYFYFHTISNGHSQSLGPRNGWGVKPPSMSPVSGVVRH